MCFNRQSALMNDGDSACVPNVTRDPTLPNIMVLGPTGAGVSSVVNLIAGKDIARASNDTSRPTRRMASYQIELRDAAKIVPVTLYGIPGFGYNAKSPLEFPRVPVSLAIICMDGSPAQVRATADYLKNKWRKHGNGKIPVVVVINPTAPNLDDGWWEENKRNFPSLGVVTDHVTLIGQEKDDSTRRLHSLIIKHLTALKVQRKKQTP